MSAELLRLAERCEKETAGSRELDVLIGYAVDLRADDKYLSFRKSFDICGLEETVRMAESHQNIWCTELPHYTSSLDAAMSLVPEGWWWSGGVCKREKHASVGSEAGTFTGEIIFETFGANLPLALTAAALRALASRDDERGGK